jgi:cytochrome c556
MSPRSFLLIATPALAQFAKAGDAVKYHQIALFVMAQKLGRLAATARGKAPFDAKVAADSAAIAETMSGMTKFSATVKTGSLDNIKAALPGVGGACKACHDDFRAK